MKTFHDLQVVNTFFSNFSFLAFIADVSKHSGLSSSLQNQVIQSVFHGNLFKLLVITISQLSWKQFKVKRSLCVKSRGKYMYNTASCAHRAIRLALWGVLLILINTVWYVHLFHYHCCIYDIHSVILYIDFIRCAF